MPQQEFNLLDKFIQHCGTDKESSSSENGNLRFVRRDTAKPLPFVSEQFNVILSLAALGRLESPDFIFNETRRALKKQGLFVLATQRS